MGSRRLLLALLLTTMPLAGSAQSLSDVLFGKATKENYIGQYNYNGKRKNGFGMERWRDGSVYVGDFSEGDISGRGMKISTGKPIAHVEGAVVYVGSWRKGQKSGRGVCYDSRGNVVYDGKFAADKPVGAVPSATHSAKRFLMEERDGRLYLGETLGGRPEGFGLTVEKDGRIVYGTRKGGKLQGPAMTFYSPQVWEVGTWTDGQYQAFNNSAASAENIAAWRQSKKAFNSSIRQDLLSAAGNFAQAGLNMATIAQGGQATTSTPDLGSAGVQGELTASADEAESGKAGSKKKLPESYYRDAYARWTKTAKSHYETLTHSGFRVVDEKTEKDKGGTAAGTWSKSKFDGIKMNLRKAQREMQKIRQEARRAGYTIEKSEYETINVSF